MKSGMIAAEEVLAALYNQSDESVAGGKSVDSFEPIEVKGDAIFRVRRGFKAFQRLSKVN
eukprot:750391-Hanusia_phi.AAC.4